MTLQEKAERHARFWKDAKDGTRVGILIGMAIGLFATAFMLIGYGLHP